MNLWVLDDVYAGSRVNFTFWLRHLVSNMNILLNYGNPELKIIYFSYFSYIMLNWIAFVSNVCKKPAILFSVFNIWLHCACEK